MFCCIGERFYLYTQKFILVVVYFVAGYFLEKFGKFLISKFVKAAKRFSGRRKGVHARVKTIIKLLGNIYSTFLYLVVGLNILKLLGIDITPFIAGASVIGLAIGFGSKELVKDLVSGFFVIFDGQYNVGDYVEAAGYKGKVQEIGIRTTILKGPDGAKYIIPNGQITKVAVYTKKPPWWGEGA